MKERSEIKFRLSEHQAYLLKREIGLHLKRDPHAELKSGYLVTSLYFDSPNLQAYHDKMEGESIRIKYRLRTYDHCSKSWKLEFKHKKYGRVFKQTEALAESDVQLIMSGQSPLGRGPLMEEFLRRRHLFQLKPLVGIEYWRDAFVSRVEDDLRLTFDSQLQFFIPDRGLYPINSEIHPIIIFESKFNHQPPAWLSSVTRSLHLKVEPYSKYVEAVKFLLV